MMVTGANQGGKSTFLRSVGIAALMMQCGMFVPARSFVATVYRGVFTHYRRAEDTTMTSGKLDEELGRMSAIVDVIHPGSLLLSSACGRPRSCTWTSTTRCAAQACSRSQKVEIVEVTL